MDIQKKSSAMASWTIQDHQWATIPDEETGEHVHRPSSRTSRSPDSAVFAGGEIHNATKTTTESWLDNTTDVPCSEQVIACIAHKKYGPPYPLKSFIEDRASDGTPGDRRKQWRMLVQESTRLACALQVSMTAAAS
jgi:hypothetical protein